MKSYSFAKRLTAVLLVLLMLLPAVSLAATMSVTTQPQDEYCEPGDTVTFTAKAKNAKSISWKIITQDAAAEFYVKDVAKHFPGVTVKGKNSAKLQLINVPLEMDGCSVVCVFTDGKNKLESDPAVLYVTEMEPQGVSEQPVITAAPAQTAQPAAPGSEDADEADEPEDADEDVVLTASGEQKVKVIGATLTVGGKTIKSGEVDFSAEGKIDFKVSSKSKVSYWVINGARYDFKPAIKNITVKDLTWGMTIEAVVSGKKAKTLLSDAELQKKRTGATLLATSKNAKLCHITAKNKGAGGWFKEFDFTRDFINRATEQQEAGGRVDLTCRAVVPSTKKINYWKFNNAKMIFASTVSEFTVHGLNETMEYRVVLEDKPKPTPTPVPTEVPKYRIICQGCTFTGGGYRRGTTGMVPYGTTITVTPNDRVNTGKWGSGGEEVKPNSITRKITKNTSFTWIPFIVN